MWTTFKSMFGKPVRSSIRKSKRPVRTRFRGRHVLKRYDNGLEEIIGCSLCAAACPSDAIFVEASENAERRNVFRRVSVTPATYEIICLRCIFCGFCEDCMPQRKRSFSKIITSFHLSSGPKPFIQRYAVDSVPDGVKTTPQKVEPGALPVPS